MFCAKHAKNPFNKTNTVVCLCSWFTPIETIVITGSKLPTFDSSYVTLQSANYLYRTSSALWRVGIGSKEWLSPSILREAEQAHVIYICQQGHSTVHNKLSQRSNLAEVDHFVLQVKALL